MNQVTFRGELSFSNGIKFIRDFVVLQHLDDFDVIIGRDLLKEGRFFMDLAKGEFCLYFPAE